VNPFYVFSSYGNDSIALLEFLHREGVEEVFVVYSDTGWAAPSWGARVEIGERWARELGFTPLRTKSVGMVELVREHKGWPRCRRGQFCTFELKVKPALELLDELDPRARGTCVVGIRREESTLRAEWPEWKLASERHGGRDLWSPLVTITAEERDRLLRESPFTPLPHRSLECHPCVCANRGDLRLLTDERVAEIEDLEEELSIASGGKQRVIFRPRHFKGEIGIRRVWEWAKSDPGKHARGQLPLFEIGGECDSGYCGS